MVVKVQAGVFEEVEDEFKSLGAFVVRVGDVLVVGMVGELSHSHYFFVVRDRRGEFLESMDIVVVHPDNDVEFVEVVFLYGS